MRASIGIDILMLVAPCWGVPMIVRSRTFRRHRHRELIHGVWRFLLHNVATLPMILARISLLGYLGGGMYWLTLGLIASLVVGIIGAWVLLLEILR